MELSQQVSSCTWGISVLTSLTAICSLLVANFWRPVGLWPCCFLPMFRSTHSGSLPFLLICFANPSSRWLTAVGYSPGIVVALCSLGQFLACMLHALTCYVYCSTTPFNWITVLVPIYMHRRPLKKNITMNVIKYFKKLYCLIYQVIARFNYNTWWYSSFQLVSIRSFPVDLLCHRCKTIITRGGNVTC